MSDIRVVSTGKIFWKIDPAVAGLLCEAFPESFAVVAAPAPAAVHARWTNSIAQASGLKFINVQCPKCNRSDRFDGSVEHLALFENSLCVHAGPCPNEVLVAYGDGGLQTYGLQAR
jgi:phage FluMu protein Com